MRALKNTWYLGAEMELVLAAIKKQLNQTEVGILVLIGFSMGSFGCIRAANFLNTDRLMLFSPVVTLDTGIERRWLSDYQELLPDYQTIRDEVLPLIDGPDVFVVYDPEDHDKQQISFLASQATITSFQLVGAGHNTMAFLKDGGTLEELTRRFLDDRIDILHVRSILRATRRNTARYLLKLYDQLKSKPVLRQLLLRYGLARFRNDYRLKLLKATEKSSLGQTGEAGLLTCQTVVQAKIRKPNLHLAKAITSYVAAGGNVGDVADVVSILQSSAPRPREP